jgi:hypothetical protein
MTDAEIATRGATVIDEVTSRHGSTAGLSADGGYACGLIAAAIGPCTGLRFAAAAA